MIRWTKDELEKIAEMYKGSEYLPPMIGARARSATLRAILRDRYDLDDLPK